MKYGILFCSFLFTTSCFAQSWLEASGKAIQGMGGKAVSGEVSSQIEKGLTSSIRAARMTKPALSPVQIRSLVAGGTIYEEIVPSILVAPELERVSLLHQEFLTLLSQPSFSLSADHHVQTLTHFRTDMVLKRKVLDDIKKYQTPEEIDALLANPSSEEVKLLLQTLADVSAIGLLGNNQDPSVLLAYYERAQNTFFEPFAFTAVSRSLTSLKAYPQLEALLRTATQTEAYTSFVSYVQTRRLPVSLPKRSVPAKLPHGVNKMAELIAQQGKITALQADFSTDALKTYLGHASRLSAQLPKTAERGASTNPMIRQSLATETGNMFGTDGNWTGFQAPENPLLATKRPLVEEAPVQTEGYSPEVPVLESKPRINPVNKQYPSGLQDETRLISDWLEYFRNGYFHPRDQIEAIRGMSPAKANNLMEYLYYMPLEEAEQVILNPIRDTGRLPDFMYDNRLISGTRRLPSGYYKNKFNTNIKRFIELADADGSLFSHNVELKDLATAMEDYSFVQGFSYKNDPQLTAGLRSNWRALVSEIQNRGFNADRSVANALWRKPVVLSDGTSVSLRDYFTQTRNTAFFHKRMPEFYLNSKKWVSWENERRNLAAAEASGEEAVSATWADRIQDYMVLGNRQDYLTLEQFGDIMAAQYNFTYGQLPRDAVPQATIAETAEDAPSSLQIRVNSFDKLGGVCQASFAHGGYMGGVSSGYDGTCLVNRFEAIEYENVDVVTFDVATLKPQIVTLKKVAYLKDIKKPDMDQLRASSMVGDGLDMTRDLLRVEKAEAALVNLPHLRATIHPHNRLPQKDLPPYLQGGGLSGYLALFTPDFYPIKKISRLKNVDGRLQFVTEYYIRKEVATLSGLIHRDHLTFTDQVQDRIVKKK